MADEEVDQEIHEWNDFSLNHELVQTLKDRGFDRPTEVQAHSLRYIKFMADLIIAARTGEGKTLCFLLPILNNLITTYEKELQKHGLEHSDTDEAVIAIQKSVFRKTHALILTPTRELAIQIKEHCQKVIPEKYKKILTTCELIGGMSLQKQERKLSYEPSIIIGTPGRVWELIDDIMNEYLNTSLPRHLDVLVLDEADRMVEVGHFREMNFILDFIYIKREEIALQKGESEETKIEKKKILTGLGNMLTEKSHFRVGKNLEKENNAELQMLIDQAEDLGDDFEDIDADNFVLDDTEINQIEDKMTVQKKHKKHKNNHNEMMMKKRGRKEDNKEKEEEKSFVPKMRGIQTIVCSATLTLDAKGRIRPTKNNKKNDKREHFDALEEICKKLRFKQKKPKVINLTTEDKMPSKLIETYHRCTNDEKDLYTFYFLQNHIGESTIIFVNSITCIKRLTSMLKILQIPHSQLHSKMQQRARLKNFDRFKKNVETIKANENSETKAPTAVLVCTDVAARGLDIPNVDNVVHYQMPMNAEIYVHRCGRTARIGKEGLAFSLFAPEDEKKFKLIYKVLKGKDTLVNLHDSIKPLKINIVELERYKGYIKSAKELEKAVFDKRKNSMRANWLLKLSKETGIEITDELKKEVEGFEEFEKAMTTKRQDKEEQEQNRKKKREKKADDLKIGALKKDFSNMKAYKDLVNVSSKSSFLNPMNVKYLNNALFGEGKLNNHELNKTIMIDYLKPDSDIKRKRKKGKKRQVKRRDGKRKRLFAKV